MAAVHAAVVVQQMLQREEEEMTAYKKEDLEGWEFKILRSAISAFKNPEALNQAVAEEAAFGWELVEKFDNGRLRFKRPTSARNLPAPSGSDPYRTEFGISEGRWVAYVMLGLILVFALIGLAVMFFTS